MQLILRTLILITAASTTMNGQCWQRVWHDGFNSGTIAKGKWTFETGGGGWGNGELETYTSRPENARVEDGHLLITAVKDASGAYTSARMKTAGHAYWRYGKFEARIKMPSAPGMWPAFWMLPEDSVYGTWPRSGEIDITEVVGLFPGRSYATIHTIDAKGNHVSFGDSTDLATGAFQDDFHVFSVEWDATSMKFALDGNVYAMRTKPLPNGGVWPFDQPFYFILNLAVGGQWPGAPTAATPFPQVMDVDWVRVSQKIEDIQLKGPDLLTPEAAKRHYEVPEIPGATYAWSVSDGAAILSGVDKHKAQVDWGTAATGTVTVTVTTDCGTATKSMDVTITPNLWVNPTFVDGFSNWGLVGAGKFEIIADAADGDHHAARVTVAKPGSVPWDIQLVRSNMQLTAGTSYSVSFYARSDQPKTIPFSIIDAKTYSTYANAKIELTTDWKQYTLTYKQAVNAAALFTIDLATAAGVYDFDGFQFVKQ